jgi:hypothetical protein
MAPGLYLDTPNGPTRIWPPPDGGYVSRDASEDAQEGLALLARAARTAREDAAERSRLLMEREAMYERALDQRRRRRGEDEWETRSSVRSSRGTWHTARHGFEPPPLERGAWRDWSERVRCGLGSPVGRQLGDTPVARARLIVVPTHTSRHLPPLSQPA